MRPESGVSVVRTSQLLYENKVNKRPHCPSVAAIYNKSNSVFRNDNRLIGSSDYLW